MALYFPIKFLRRKASLMCFTLFLILIIQGTIVLRHTRTSGQIAVYNTKILTTTLPPSTTTLAAKTLNNTENDVEEVHGSSLQIPYNITISRGSFLMDMLPQSKKINYTDEEIEYYHRRTTKINEFKQKFVLNGSHICNEDTYLVILTHSWHKYSDRRNTIRDSWGRIARGKQWPNKNITHNVKHVFVFGTNVEKSLNQAVLQEADQYHDIIQGDFKEDYKNMTLKSMMGLKWVSEFCPSARYVLKTDDDMILNIPLLLNVLEQANFNRTLMGPYCHRSKVYRAGKWGVKKEDYPFKFYPPYLAGSAYVISSDIVKELYDTAEYLPAIHVDDAFITGIVAKVIDVQHVTMFGFAYAVSKPPKACDIVNDKIVAGTKMTPLKLRKLWNELDSNPKCK